MVSQLRKIVILDSISCCIVGTEIKRGLMNTTLQSTEENKKFLVYNASAGSGKTYTLVREYLRLALSGDNPFYFKRILAITFTKKAAGEMKDRILDHLRKLAAEPGSPEHDATLFAGYMQFCSLGKEQLARRSAQVLRTILHNYSELSVSTIDSFLHLIIRNFARDLRLPMDFDVVIEKDTLVEEAVDRLIDEAGKNKEITEMLSSYLEFNTEEGDRWEIGVLLRKFANSILFREDSIAPLQALDQLEREELSELRKKINALLASRRKEALEMAEKVIAQVEAQGLRTEDFHYGQKGPFTFFLRLREQHGRIEECPPNSYFKKASENDAWFSKAAKKQMPAAVAAVQPLLDEVHPQVMKWLSDQQYHTAIVLQKQLFQLALLREVSVRIEEMKKEKDLLFIDDFNRMISSLILNDPAPFIYERIGELYAHIMIDEFQDTSVLQWQNFIPLVENSLAKGLSCLIVGDGKQSIYRFRNGEVEQFARLPKLYGHEKDPLMQQKQWLFEHNFRLETLGFNHRSGKVIVEFNNQFFSKFRERFQHHLASVYQQNEQQVPQGREYGYVEVHFADKETSSAEINQRYCDITLQKIESCLQDAYHYSDICVLVRSNKEGDQIASALTAKNIPVISPDSLLIRASRKVQLLVGLLQWLAEPHNEEVKGKIIECFLHLRNPDADVLPYLRESKTKNEAGKNQISIEKFFSQFGIVLSADAFLRFSLYQLAENLIRAVQVDREDAFVNAFLDQVFRFSQRENDLSAFNNWWKESGYKQSVQLPDTANAVKIMTIHKSKGLQFPVVILPFLIWHGNKLGKDALWIDLDPVFAPLQTALISGGEEKFRLMGKEEEYLEEKRRSELDNMNLLYVAFTRAEERLYLFTQRNKGWAGNILSEYLDQQEGVDEVLTYGEKSPAKRKVKNAGAEMVLAGTDAVDWQNRLRISYESQRVWGETESLSAARFGSAVHLLLSSIQSLHDVDEQCDALALEGKLLNVSVEELKTEVGRILLHPFMQEIFDSSGQHKNEAEIVSAQGEIVRPDRIVFYPDKTKVIDFKTGVRRKKHEEQIRRYGDLLTEMAYPNVEKFLFYTSDNLLIQID